MTTIDFTHDTEGILALLKRNDHYFAGADPVEQRKSVEQGICYGAFVDSQMVGCIVYHELNPEACEIVWLAVHPDFQSQGIGSELLTTTTSLLPPTCKIIEVKTLSEVDPDPGYQRTRKFYMSHGFISLETIHPYPGWGEDNPCQIFVKIR